MCKLKVLCYFTELIPDINICDAKNKLLSLGSFSVWIDKRMSVKLTNAYDFTMPIVSAKFILESTKPCYEKIAVLINAKKYGVTPLMVAAQRGKM